MRWEAPSAIERIIRHVLVVASLSLALLGLAILIVRAGFMPPDRGLVIVGVTVAVLLSLPLVQRWTGALCELSQWGTPLVPDERARPLPAY